MTTNKGGAMQLLTKEEGIKWMESLDGKKALEQALMDGIEATRELREERIGELRKLDRTFNL
jgi:hypothetical protein